MEVLLSSRPAELYGDFHERDQREESLNKTILWTRTAGRCVMICRWKYVDQVME